jgi:hypothetical protein
MKRTLLAGAAVLLACTSLWALDDTPDNRRAQADRYVTVMPVNELLEDLADKATEKLPPERKQLLKELLNKNLDQPALEKVMKGVAVKHFTADELSALADFCGSPAGKSALKKFGPYMGDLMPAIKAETLKAAKKGRKAAGGN